LKKKQKMIIGIDFGNTLSIQDEDGKMNTSIDMPGAMQALEQLRLNGHKLYLISFCGRKRAEQTKIAIEGLFDGFFFYKNSKCKSIDL
jgi:hypothetical protein